MKRILCLILCLAGGWMAIRAQYRVYAYEGAVQYKKAGPAGQWRPATEDVALEGRDTLRIPEPVESAIPGIGAYRIRACSVVALHFIPQSG